jgi:Enolase
MSEIVNADIRKILDSRGNETVEVDIYTKYGFGRASAPSGASKGENEVKDYPQGVINESLRIFKQEVAPKIIGFDASDQINFDALLEEIDGTGNFSRIGGNLAVAISIAAAKASSDEFGIPLYRYLGGLNYAIPAPLGNVIGGGVHAVNGTTIQEFLISTHSKDVYEAILTNAKIHKTIKDKLSKNLNTPLGMGDEKAWVVPLKDDEVFELLSGVVQQFRDLTGLEIDFGIDLAASNFYKNGKYHYKDKTLTREEQIDFVISLIKEYGLKYVEDPMEENDFEGYAAITKEVGDMAYIVGDDIYTTNKDLLQKGLSLLSTNAILLKPNQVGTVSRLIRTWKLAKENGLGTIVSHRSGETNDEFIAHLAVGLSTDYIKTGTVGGERIAKLNELVRIQGEIGGIR